MSGQATVTIDSSQWSVVVASSYSELLTGLSNHTSLDARAGMLFDMGSDRDSIAINMDGMAFALDIAFINSSGVVVGVERNVLPDVGVTFDSAGGLGARYFLEVNAGEMVSVIVGSTMTISNYVPDADTGIDLGSIVSLMIAMMMMGIMMKMMV